MIREASAMKVRKNLGELLNEVQYRRNSVLVTKGGKPVAALVDIGLFEKIRLLDKEFDRLTAELTKAYKGGEPATAEKENGEAAPGERRKAEKGVGPATAKKKIEGPLKAPRRS